MLDLPEVTLFVPGYRGSFLVTSEQKRAWLTVGEALLRGDRSLALPFDGQRPEKNFGTLLPDGPLTGFTVVPLIAAVDVYARWMEFGAAQLPGFTAFAYDWRQDIRASARQLCGLIEALAAARRGRLQVNIVAHSMGGLVALHCLRYGTGPDSGLPTWAGARYVRKVVFVGTPFRGSPGIFQDLLKGTVTGRNTALMSVPALFSFTSSFQLLPPEDDVLFAQPPAQATRVLEPGSWWSFGWGVFSDADLHDNEAYRAQQRRQLAAHAELWRSLGDAPGPLPGFQTLVVTGVGHAVKSGFPEANGAVDFRRPTFGDGDGTVLAKRAVPPQPLQFEQKTSRADHGTLLKDASVQEAILQFLKGARRPAETPR